MGVKFVEAPRVVTYALEEGESMRRRKEAANLSVEHQREMKLYALVLKWKARNPEQAARWPGQTLEAFMGAQRSATVRSLGVDSIAQLVTHASTFVLDQWPTYQIQGPRELQLTSMIIISLVAGFLCKYLRYDLEQPAEQDALYCHVYHIAQYLLRANFC
mmetsp:Transcript_6254/g.11125  ORF Transcript_6254/g.11125 Transcript_6254/m.11125 type:complete len:160 (+) Transcript_6254:244-723(+)|eukprot:CAMPEP_0184549578 /NCGR_PEP_ID=MMETSP0199_2-20130426/10899_1 /TAXON_ID=1112570 /ORGANISM="Thraustochytrium sp., Strain LLF1b" /LENGTH=159 /DNA_ID=CAMNT_0026944317 /DNA_START=218 /DNA_END=697 /DNA_ORIENTATION=+